MKTATFVATPCAVACWTTGRPVRIILDLETNMNMLGKRHPFRIPYEVTFDEEGRIGILKMDVICDSGIAFYNLYQLSIYLYIKLTGVSE